MRSKRFGTISVMNGYLGYKSDMAFGPAKMKLLTFMNATAEAVVLLMDDEREGDDRK